MNDNIKTARIALGGFIRERREEMGVTQEELGAFVGVTANTIHGVETGRFAMDIDLQFKIYQALEIKPYFSTTSHPLDDEDYTLRSDDDPKRYVGFYISENLNLYPGELAIIKLTYPRLFVRFNYGDSLFIDFEDWKNNHTELQWLDQDDKPEDEEEIEAHLIDCWNFLALPSTNEQKKIIITKTIN